MGVGLFWHCPVCGVGGGPAWPEGMTQRMVAKGLKARWEPFIPGHDRRVSEDCQEAQKQIREYGEELIAGLRAKWKNSKGEHSHYASLFHDALRWNPQITDVINVLDLMRDVESPTALRNNKRPSLMDCRKELVKAGFDMSGGALGAAVRGIGDEMYRRQRSGEDE